MDQEVQTNQGILYEIQIDQSVEYVADKIVFNYRTLKKMLNIEDNGEIQVIGLNGTLEQIENEIKIQIGNKFQFNEVNQKSLQIGKSYQIKAENNMQTISDQLTVQQQNIQMQDIRKIDGNDNKINNKIKIQQIEQTIIDVSQNANQQQTEESGSQNVNQQQTELINQTELIEINQNQNITVGADIQKTKLQSNEAREQIQDQQTPKAFISIVQQKKKIFICGIFQTSYLLNKPLNEKSIEITLFRILQDITHHIILCPPLSIQIQFNNLFYQLTKVYYMNGLFLTPR